MYDFEIEYCRGILYLNVDGLFWILVKCKCIREKCFDCDFLEYLVNNYGLNLEVVVEEGKFLYEEFKYFE